MFPSFFHPPLSSGRQRPPALRGSRVPRADGDLAQGGRRPHRHQSGERTQDQERSVSPVLLFAWRCKVEIHAVLFLSHAVGKENYVVLVGIVSPAPTDSSLSSSPPFGYGVILCESERKKGRKEEGGRRTSLIKSV